MSRLVLAVTLATLGVALAGCGTPGSSGLNLANLPMPIYFLSNGQPVQVGQVGLMLMPAQPVATGVAGK
jgi:hypothetical protein